MSLTRLAPNDSFAEAKKKIRAAWLRHHPNKGGKNEDFLRVQMEWNNWLRKRARTNDTPQQAQSKRQRTSPPRPKPSSPQRPNPPRPKPFNANGPRYTKPIFTHFSIPQQVSIGDHTHPLNMNLRFDASQTVGHILSELRAYAVTKCPELFRGFSVEMLCVAPTHPYLRETVSIPAATNKNTKLTSLIPPGYNNGEVYIHVQARPPRGGRDKVEDGEVFYI